jgi:hypothetical protein
MAFSCLNPQTYLAQLLIGLPGTPVSQIKQWLPDQWKTAQPGAIADSPAPRSI